MQWQWEKLKKITNSLLIIFVSSHSVSAFSEQELDEKRLWLPTKYTRLFMDLKEAAMAAQVSERCKVVLRGTIDLEQGSEDHPVYRILCRQPNGRSYNQMIDGLTLKPIEKNEDRREDLWVLCENGIKNKIKLMNEVTWISQLPVEPDVYEPKKAIYTVDFDAKDGFGQPLHYRARCNFGPKDALSIRISGRK